jgi:hypothetical protein
LEVNPKAGPWLLEGSTIGGGTLVNCIAFAESPSTELLKITFRVEILEPNNLMPKSVYRTISAIDDNSHQLNKLLLPCSF